MYIRGKLTFTRRLQVVVYCIVLVAIIFRENINALVRLFIRILIGIIYLYRHQLLFALVPQPKYTYLRTNCTNAVLCMVKPHLRLMFVLRGVLRNYRGWERGGIKSVFYRDLKGGFDKC